MKMYINDMYIQADRGIRNTFSFSVRPKVRSTVLLCAGLEGLDEFEIARSQQKQN